MPGIYDLSIRQGDTYRQTFTITNPDPDDSTGQTPGTPVDLTGATCEITFVSKFNTASSFSLSSEEGTEGGSSITLGGSAGTIQVTIGYQDTNALFLGSYDLKVKFSDQTVTTFLTGQIMLEYYVAPWS